METNEPSGSEFDPSTGYFPFPQDSYGAQIAHWRHQQEWQAFHAAENAAQSLRQAALLGNDTILQEFPVTIPTLEENPMYYATPSSGSSTDTVSRTEFVQLQQEVQILRHQVQLLGQSNLFLLKSLPPQWAGNPGNDNWPSQN